MGYKRDGARRARSAKFYTVPTTTVPTGRDNETANSIARVAFLAHLETGLSVGGSARAANIGRATAYRWRGSDAEFARLWDEAIEAGTDEIEDALRKTALEGNVAACLAILKARRPEKWRERYEEPVKEKAIPAKPAVNGPGDAALLARSEQKLRVKQLEAEIIRLRQKFEPEKYRMEELAEAKKVMASMGIEQELLDMLDQPGN